MPALKPQHHDRLPSGKNRDLQRLVEQVITNSCLQDGQSLACTTNSPDLHHNVLNEYTQRINTIRHSDVHIFTLMGQQRYVMKFDRPVDRTRRRAWASAALCGILFGIFPTPKRLLPGDVRHEASRLRTLKQQGVRVPRVYLVTDSHLVLEHSGDTVEDLLKAEPSDDERNRLLWQVVDDLIEFHHAGHWHGGAQVRNLTLKNGSIYRIDFEEQVGAALPLPFAQAFDVLLAFNSMIDHLPGSDHTLGVQLLTHYLDHAHSPQIVKTLKRLEYWLGYLRRLEPHLHQNLRKKRDLQRTRMFASILNGTLA